MYSIKGFLWCLAILTTLSGTHRPSLDSTAAPVFPARPFPQHTLYQPGTILPNHISQRVMDDSARSFYRPWKQHYILPGCTEGEAYVWFQGTTRENICVSD